MPTLWFLHRGPCLPNGKWGRVRRAAEAGATISALYKNKTNKKKNKKYSATLTDDRQMRNYTNDGPDMKIDKTFAD